MCDEKSNFGIGSIAVNGLYSDRLCSWTDKS